MSSATPIDLRRPLTGVRYERANHVATITLDRPERGNALLPAMQPILRAIWSEVRDEPDIRVAVVRASGERHFCTGFDIAEANGKGEASGKDEAEGDDAESVFVDAPLAESVHWSPHQNRVWKPVICAVNGLCVGGGLHFVVDSDIVLASKNAAFVDAHVNVGMVGALENIGLAKRLPLGTALRMTLQGRDFRLSAERAHHFGLVDELVETPADLDAAIETLCASLLKNSPRAMALSKQAVWAGLELGYSEALEAGWSRVKQHWSHPDFEEGPRAFAEKREPRWNPDPNAKTADDDGGSEA